MSLNPTGAVSHGWNYSRPDVEGYSQTLTGTVLGLQEVQRREYNPSNPSQGRPQFWPDGKPKMSIRMILVDQAGQLKTFTFQPASKAAREGKKKSIHMDLFALAGGRNMTDLIGKTISIATYEPENGGKWGQGNPRPFGCMLSEEGPFAFDGEMPAEYKLPQVLLDDAVSGGQFTPKPQPQAPQYYPAPTIQGTYAPQPQVPMPQFQQPAMQPMQYQRPQVVPMPQQQPAAQPQMTAPMPQGMDPGVMAAMQQMGAVNVQPVQSSPYDEDIPF